MPHVPASESFATRPRFCIPHDRRVLCALCFHGLTNCFPATPLYSHRYKLPGGMGVKQAKPSAQYEQWALTSVHSSTYELFVAAKNSNSFVFSQIHTLWAKHLGWGTLTTRRCSESRFFRGFKIGPQLGKLPPTRAGCHNSPLHTEHLATRVCLARHLSLLLLGVIHGCPR